MTQVEKSKTGDEGEAYMELWCRMPKDDQLRLIGNFLAAVQAPGIRERFISDSPVDFANFLGNRFKIKPCEVHFLRLQVGLLLRNEVDREDALALRRRAG